MSASQGTFAIRGWCPDAWRPMAAGDGLLMRVKPRLARLSREQGLALAGLARRFGNGLIDVTSRANLQLRGVQEAGWPELLDKLVALALVDAEPLREARRNVLVAPDWQVGDDTHRIALALLDKLPEFPELPGKMGFVIDAGAAPMLREEPGDFRIERGLDGALILRADGREAGAPLAPGSEVEALPGLAQWFVASGGAASGRMARHHAALPDWAAEAVAPAAGAALPDSGVHPLGTLVVLPFGQADAARFEALLDHPQATGLRFLPGRRVLVEGVFDDALADPADAALLHVDACPGAPQCPQASVSTRDLARALAPLVLGRLHVSGCAKGCARSAPADLVLTGREGLFDLAFHARAGAPPEQSGLTPADLLARFGAA
ncbi:cobalamin biosynthesis protein CobG [Novosphingobium sp. 9]|uniref:cobalamin biosynthesis protein CobG n=1 Tax=Novosphingobium sp. 9 TaxID=2025349 RepID=UPI0021B61DC1|nr:cobalamin biosynthesis protein CobG [Novosphingobium sp. 9]